MMNKEIAKLLKQKGDLACAERSEILENETAEIRNLNLRNIGLDEKDIVDITHIIDQENDNIYIKSISFSYN